MLKYVRHMSGIGQTWKVLFEGNDTWWVENMNDRAINQVYLPKSEYVYCESPFSWIDVTSKCEVNSFGHIMCEDMNTEHPPFRRRKVQQGDSYVFVIEKLLVDRESVAPTIQDNVNKSLELIRNYGSTDGSHHKDWVLDQVVRSLTGDGYAKWVEETKAGEDGPDTYSYSEGIAP